MKHPYLLCLLFFLPSFVFGQNFTNGFAFYLPPNDTTRQEFLPQFPIVPIVDDAFISISPDGHFALNGQRIRFFGTNCTIEGAFPTQAKAWYIAGRLRKMGYNLVRFHHMDNGWSQHSLFEPNQDTRHLNPETLDRLENFIYFLKQNGIYADINLHVSRTVKEVDGVVDADSIPDFGKGVSLFDPHILELHKEFAQQLLTHTNPYTGLALVNDPVMAVVEITNENSLYRMWRDDDLAPFTQGGKLTKHHTAMLDQQWHDFLKSKYPDTQTLRSAWSQGIRPAGAGEQIKDGGFETDPISRNWQMEQHNGAAATMAIDETQAFKGNKCAKINVTKVTGTNWHIQWKQIGITIKKDSLYSVSFAARANAPQNITIAIQQDTDPWTVFYSTSIDLNSEWKTFQFSFLASTTVTKAIRLSYSLGGAIGAYWFDEIQLYPSAIKGLADDESLEAETVKRINFSECVSYSDPRVKDMSDFYISTQNHYYSEMASFLKNTLGVKAPIVGTNWNVGPADLAVQSRLDYIDNHAYWDHPQFPNVAWDSYDWLINNTPMVRDDAGGAIVGLLAGVAVAGKPFTISEYNHAFPNRYQTEGVLFLTTYSAFHDADGLMFFDYPSSYNDWETDFINGFFAQHRNTAMMALMPSCAQAFRSGLIQSAQQTILINYSENDILNLPKYDDRWWAGPRLFPHKIALQHAVRTGSFASAADFDPALLPAEPTNPYISDTDEIEWNTNGLLQVQTDQFVAAAGFFSEFKNTTIGALKLIDGSDFGALTWVSLSDTSLIAGTRSLFTLSSRVQNSDMKWDGSITVHNQWGSAPTLMAPLAVTVEFTLQADSIQVYPLDAIGAPSGRVYSYRATSPNRFTVVLDQNKDKTVWYGIRKFGLGSAVESRHELPDRFKLLPNYPNPFNPCTHITYHIPYNGRVKLEIFDLLGRLSQTCVDEFKAAGVYTVD
ncbi:MAG: hypothetical protein EHM72_12415, partial [Calditrichaeota bacterium]